MGCKNQISVQNDAWIPGCREHRIHELINDSTVNVVSELIIAQRRVWNEELIRNTFSQKVVSRILQIPFSVEPHEDFQVWCGEPSSEFTVHSAYRILQEERLFSNLHIAQIDITSFYRKL